MKRLWGGDLKRLPVKSFQSIGAVGAVMMLWMSCSQKQSAPETPFPTSSELEAMENSAHAKGSTLLAAYPEVVKKYVEGCHWEEEWLLRRHKVIFLATWWVEGDPRVKWNNEVHEDGAYSAFVDSFQRDGTGQDKLTGSAFTRLKRTLASLPTNSQSPPLSDLLVISYRDGTNWTTRTFDRRNPAPEVKAVFEIIGDPRNSPIPGKSPS